MLVCFNSKWWSLFNKTKVLYRKHTVNKKKKKLSCFSDVSNHIVELKGGKKVFSKHVASPCVIIISGDIFFSTFEVSFWVHWTVSTRLVEMEALQHRNSHCDKEHWEIKCALNAVLRVYCILKLLFHSSRCQYLLSMLWYPMSGLFLISCATVKIKITCRIKKKKKGGEHFKNNEQSNIAT